MRKCSSCGYIDKARRSLCPVCGADMKKAIYVNEPAKKIPLYYLPFIALAFLAGFYGFRYLVLPKASPVKKMKLPAQADYLSGVESSLDSLAMVIIPDTQEENIVLKYAGSGNDRIKMAAARTLLYWAAYSLDRREFYIKNAGALLSDPDFKMKKEAIGMFISMLSLKTFQPSEFSVILKDLSSCVCSSDNSLREKAMELALLLEPDRSICGCISSILKDSGAGKNAVNSRYVKYCLKARGK